MTTPAIRLEGGLFGPDILDHLLSGELPGQKSPDFGFDARRSLTDEIAAVFSEARARNGRSFSSDFSVSRQRIWPPPPLAMPGSSRSSIHWGTS